MKFRMRVYAEGYDGEWDVREREHVSVQAVSRKHAIEKGLKLAERLADTLNQDAQISWGADILEVEGQ